jgi:hypothetical protein
MSSKSPFQGLVCFAIRSPLFNPDPPGYHLPLMPGLRSYVCFTNRNAGPEGR